ncbi:Rho termination factor N-terminal domain-containing protein, partial [Actinotalea ferrariae]|uniref:Rho termination factor N-terminal domain-containing protein n=1 Tax=Actinotalea ferrariae TaxID=1386098 RepID=UPI000556721A
MTETIEAAELRPDAASAPGTRSGALSTLRLPELQALAAELGVPGTTGMRKSDLLSAIRERRESGKGAATRGSRGARSAASTTDAPQSDAPATDAPQTPPTEAPPSPTRAADDA